MIVIKCIQVIQTFSFAGALNHFFFILHLQPQIHHTTFKVASGIKYTEIKQAVRDQIVINVNFLTLNGTCWESEAPWKQLD